MVVFLGGGGGGILLFLLLSMLGCVDGQGVFAPNRTIPPTLKCMLIVSYIDNIVPDRKLLIVSMPKVDYQNKSWPEI